MEEIELTHISLFTGIAGIDLAAEWAGFKTVLFVEIDKYSQKVLKKHWPDVPIIGDIRDVTKEEIDTLTASYRLEGWGLARSHGNRQPTGLCEEPEEEVMAITENKGATWRERFQGNDDGEGGERGTDNERSGINNGSEGYRYAAAAANFPITLITGGFPCQPVSHAGKRKGKEDDRWLWPEMLRVISEVRPAWVVAENVAGLLNMGFNDCVSDLEGQGYETQSFLIPACAVNALHRRDRIFIVAYSRCLSNNGRGSERRSQEGSGPCNRTTRPGEYASDVADTEEYAQGGLPGRKTKEQSGPQQYSSVVSNSKGKGLERADSEGNPRREGCAPEYGQGGWQADWWAVEPELGRVAHGIPNRVDRLKCLGNAVVPQQIYPILKAIADIELLNVTIPDNSDKRLQKEKVGSGK